MSADAFAAQTQKYVDVPKLTPTIVNEYINKIEVSAPDKSNGKRVQKVKIYFNLDSGHGGMHPPGAKEDHC